MNILIENKKTLLILTGVSGSGKSTFAEYLKSIHNNCEICCADDFFMSNGDYTFNIEHLGLAHDWCKAKANRCFEDGVELVILANTNTCQKEYGDYISSAEKHGYKVVSVIMQNLTGTKNIHSVPEKTLDRQENKIKNSLKLR